MHRNKIRKYNVLIIGAGNIGAFFDNPKSKNILTHAHAFTKHCGFNLIGFVDANRKKARNAAVLWGTTEYQDIEDAFRKEVIDVAIIAVPDEVHYEVLKKISVLPVKLVFVEKPVAKTLQQARDIFKIYDKRKIPVAVNYIRRYVPEFEKLKNEILKGRFGEYVTGTGYYGKGILHNGSHMVDLLMYFMGQIQSSRIIESVCDAYKDDPSVTAVLTLHNGKKFFLQHVDSRMFTIFEMDLLFERKRIRITDLGFILEKYSLKENSMYKGYRNMVFAERKQTSLGKSLFHCAENLYSHLLKGAELKSSLKDALEVTKVCESIRIQANG